MLSRASKIANNDCLQTIKFAKRMPSTYEVGNGSLQRPASPEIHVGSEINQWSDMLTRSYGYSPRSGFSTLTEGEYMRHNISTTPSPTNIASDDRQLSCPPKTVTRRAEEVSEAYTEDSLFVLEL